EEFTLVQNDSIFSVFFCKAKENGEKEVHLIATGTNLYETMNNAMHASLNSKKLSNNLLTPLFQNLGLELEKSISHEKIIDIVSFLIQSGCPIKFVVIEDGWQQLEDGRLKNFDADSKCFPLGL